MAFGPMLFGARPVPDMKRQLRMYLSYVVVNATAEQTHVFTLADLIPCVETELFKSDLFNITTSIVEIKKNIYVNAVNY